MADIRELNSLYRNGIVPPHFMLTSSYHIKPAPLTGAGGIAAIDDSVIRPIANLCDSGIVVRTNFTALNATWQTSFNSRGYTYDPQNPSRVETDPGSPPSTFALTQNYPNPFNPMTNVEFRIPNDGFVSLKVYDLLGREVATLVDEERQAGAYVARWNATGFASGVYFYRLQTSALVQTQKMLLMR